MMPNFDNGVSPPSPASYSAPLLNFQQFANWANDYQQGGLNAQQQKANDQQYQTNTQQQQLNDQRILEGKRQQQLADALQGGGALDANGKFDPQKAQALFAKFGVLDGMTQMAPLVSRQDAANTPIWPAANSPGAGSSPSSVPAKPLPPVSANSPQGDPGSGTVASIVTDRLPAQDTMTGQTISKVAQALGVEPNAVLTPGQLRRAQVLAQRYAGGGDPDGRGTAPSVAPSQPSASVSPRGDAGSGSIASIVSSRLPNQDGATSATITRIAETMGVDDPNAPLTPGQVRRAQGLLQRYAPTAGAPDTSPSSASANSRVAGGFGDLPPSANGVSAKPQITRQALPQSGNPGFQPSEPAQAQAGAPIGAASAGGPSIAPGRPQGGAPIPAAPGGAPLQQPQPPQPQGGPITPIPNDPRNGRQIQSVQQANEVLSAIDQRIVQLSSNPNNAVKIQQLEQERERIETAIAPVSVTPSTTRLDPFTGQPLYQGNQPSMSSDAVHNAAERYLETGQLPPNLGRGVQGSANSNAIQEQAAELARQRGIDPADLPGKWQQFKAQQVAIQRFTSGKQGDTIKSFNVLVDHLDTLGDAASALKNGDYRFLNQWKQRYAAETGGTAPTNFDGVKALVGDEIVKAVVGGAGALADREEVKKDLDRASSPKQLSELVDKYRKLALGQLKGLRKQYEVATGQKNFGDQLLPGTLAALGGSEEKVTPGAQSTTPGGLNWSLEK
jgi:hypothetical protein